MFDLLGDLIGLPFEIIGESVECLFGCITLTVIACCILMVIAVLVLGG